MQKITDTKFDKNIVIVRANLNVKVRNGEIVDDSKVKALIPTLEYLNKANSKVIILGHLGDGNMEYNDEFSLIPVRFALGRYLTKQLKFVNISNPANSIKFMEFGDMLLIENLNFSPEEFSKDVETRVNFVKRVAEFADFYVDESFGVDKNLATTGELPKLLNSHMGLNHVLEIEAIEKIREHKEKPFVAVIGGGYNKTKKEILNKLGKIADIILLGGEVALHADEIKGKAQIITPVDYLVSKSKDSAENVKVSSKPGEFTVDIGPKTIEKYKEIIESAKTLILNGPMGIYEIEEFSKGTNEIFECATLLSVKDCFKIVGGEDTMAAVNQLKIKHKKFSHITTDIREFVASI